MFLRPNPLSTTQEKGRAFRPAITTPVSCIRTPESDSWLFQLQLPASGVTEKQQVMAQLSPFHPCTGPRFPTVLLQPQPSLAHNSESSPQPPSLVYFCLSASEKSCHLLLLSNRKKIKVTTNIPLLIILQTLNSDYKTRKPSGGRSTRQRVKKGHIKEQWLAVHQVNLKRCSASSMSAGQMEGEQRSS